MILAPWLGIILVLLALLGLMAGLHAFRAHASPHPEIVRKLLHVGMGLVTLTFPWLFVDTWPVWVLAGVSVALLLAAKLLPPLQARLGGVVDGVTRSSLGDVYFPISVAIIFQLAGPQQVLYVIPILLLTLADAVAALIGVFYGRQHYAGVGGQKSAEGSLAFFTVAFLSTHIPLLLFTSTGRAETLLLGLTIGLLVMLIEAVAWGGLDNLLVPLGGYFLLAGYLPMHVHTLAVLLLGTVVWVVGLLLWRKHTTLNEGALLGAALAGYLTWSLGGWLWSLPPLILFIGYPLLWPRAALLRRHPHDIHAVITICAPGLIWLGLAQILHRPEFFFPYTVSYAVQLACIGVAYYREVAHRVAGPSQLGTCVIRSWTPLFVPFVLLTGLNTTALARAGAALVVITTATVILNLVIPRPGTYAIASFPWLRQALIGSIASALCLIPLYLM